MTRTIALLTDFGTEDVYVGVMKGVMRAITPQADFIDITHAIQPQNVREGAFALLNSAPFFPPETVFLVVVDPGVGSRRRPLAVRAGAHHFVAPDNGILDYILAQHADALAVELTMEAFRRPEVSNTFHGRDVFAPAAAYLASGVAVTELGPQIERLASLPEPQLILEAGQITGEVVHIDHFGNVITSIGGLRWVGEDRLLLEPRFGEARKTVRILAEDATVIAQGQELMGIAQAYHEVERGYLLAQVDSNGFLEIAVNQGHAAERLDIKVGDRVVLQFQDQSA